jgi:tellurite resistance protein TehA-like permease
MKCFIWGRARKAAFIGLIAILVAQLLAGLVHHYPHALAAFAGKSYWYVQLVTFLYVAGILLTGLILLSPLEIHRERRLAIGWNVSFPQVAEALGEMKLGDRPNYELWSASEFRKWYDEQHKSKKQQGGVPVRAM